MSNLISREKIGEWIESSVVQKVIVALILLNSLSMGLETSPAIMSSTGNLIGVIDEVILIIFSIEILLRLYAFGWKFFFSFWNIFDTAIIAIAWFPATGMFSIMRTLRILLTLRLLTKVRPLKRLIEGLLRSIPSMGWIGVLLVLLLYIFSVMCTNLYGEAFPQFFGSISESMFTLFQIMTLEGWAMELVRPIMEQFPYSYIVFVPFILIASYITLNLFIGVVVSNMSEAPAEDVQQLQTVHDENIELRKELQDVKSQLNRIENSITEALAQRKVEV